MPDPTQEKNGRHPVPETRDGEFDAPFADAAYIPRSEAPNMPRIYDNQIPAEERDKRPKRRAASVLILCALCVLLGAGLHALVTERRNQPLPVLPEVTAEPTAVPEPTATAEPSPEPSPEPAATEAPVLTATEIYTIACEQVTGISTEITVSNVFGASSDGAVSGTGCILTSDGYVLTNYHVIEDAVQNGCGVRVVLHSGEAYDAEIVGYERDESDIAVLKIDAAGLRPIVAGDIGEMNVGETVYAVGNPLGELTYTITPGMISAMDREISTETTIAGSSVSVNMFQLSAPLSRGNSGGPVYNDRGQVVGIVTAKYSAVGVEGLGFAIPINDAISAARDIVENGYVRGKPYMGVIVQTVTAAVAEYYNQYYEDCMVVGAQVYALDEEGAAALAGLRQGDIITALDGREILSAADLTAAEKDYRAGDTAVITVYRGKEYLELTVTFGERGPDDPATAESPGNLSVRSAWQW